DDGYNPIPTIINTIQLIERDKVFALFNYVGTPTVARILPILKASEDKHILLFFPFTGAMPHRTPPYDKYVFNLRASYEQETSGLVEHFIKAGIKKIGIFYQADAYGRSGWNGVRKTFKKYGLTISGETTYRRGAKYTDSFTPQVKTLQDEGVEAVISVGAYAACAGFIRDARNAGWDVPIANVSFVGSEFMIGLLLDEEKKTGKQYTHNLINSQVVPSYEDMSLPAVREYRALMDKYNPIPPLELLEGDYRFLRYSFVSFEGFLNAKVIVEILKAMGKNPRKENIKKVAESLKNVSIGIDEKITFTPTEHQALHKVYYTEYVNGKFVPITSWDKWKKK
ncbi:MAG: ABC transporter substrate-binding protein, partial [Thermodesulfovibrionales bacterium]